MGLIHDSIGGTITGIKDITTHISDGPAFEQPGYESTGATIGVVYSFTASADLLLTTTPVAVLQITLDISGRSGDITISLTNDLGTPPVTSAYVQNGASIPFQPMTPITITDATPGGGGAVPEPSTAIAMGLLGIVGVAGNRRRRRQVSVA